VAQKLSGQVFGRGDPTSSASTSRVCTVSPFVGIHQGPRGSAYGDREIRGIVAV